MGSEFCIDDAAAKRTAFDTVIELLRVSGELVQVTVYEGHVLSRVPEAKQRPVSEVHKTVRRCPPSSPG
jgi:hypothetical protein